MQVCVSAGRLCKNAGRKPQRAQSGRAFLRPGNECASSSASRATSAACWAQSRTAAAPHTARCRSPCCAMASV